MIITEQQVLKYLDYLGVKTKLMFRVIDIDDEEAYNKLRDKIEYDKNIKIKDIKNDRRRLRKKRL
jgi:hypothetical protein